MAAPRPAQTPRSRRDLVALVAIALAVVGAAAAWRAWRGRAQAAEVRAAAAQFEIDLTDAPAPPIELASMDGRRLSLAALRGKVVFVNFWATWCPPCRAEMPSMIALGRELEQRHPGKFAMLAISVDDGWGEVGAYFAGPPPAGITVALDTEQVVTRAYYCAARHACPDRYLFPESYIVDPSGRLVAYVVGPREWSERSVRVFLESLIGS